MRAPASPETQAAVNLLGRDVGRAALGLAMRWMGATDGGDGWGLALQDAVYGLAQPGGASCYGADEPVAYDPSVVDEEGCGQR